MISKYPPFLFRYALAFVFASVYSLSLYSQTLNVPNGLNGIGSTANGDNVGIGTATPNTKLHIYNNVMDSPALILQGSTIDPNVSALHYVGLRFDGDYGNATGNYSEIRSYSNLYSNWGSHLTFHTTTASQANTLVERMRILPNGNVGIGSTNPLGKLDIEGLVQLGWNAPYLGVGLSSTGPGGGGWSRRYGFYKKADNSLLGGFGAMGGENTLNFYWIGNEYNNYSAAFYPNGPIFFNGNIGVNGKIGIGKDNPTFKTHIANTNLDNTSFNTLLAIDGNTNDESANNNFNTAKPSIGLVFRRDWNSGGTPRALAGIYAWGAYNWAGGLAFTTTPAFASGVQHTRMVITDDGNVGIGNTTPGNYKLNVSGKIRADEIVVNTTGADFVFATGYELFDLSEVEKYINENNHLPGIPSAEEMQQNGMSMSEMQTKLLQKIEELTLYAIDQQKMLQKERLRNDNLENEIEELKNLISICFSKEIDK